MALPLNKRDHDIFLSYAHSDRPFVEKLYRWLQESAGLQAWWDDRDLSAGAMLATGFAPRERERAPAQLECIRELLRDAEDIRRTGSAALDLAYVACGRLDGYFEAGVKPWDIAAGVLLVREAGGRICDFRGAGTGSLDAKGIAGRTLVAGNLKLIDSLQKGIVQSGYAAACR